MNESTYNLIAKITNPSSFYYLDSYPSMPDFGLDHTNSYDKKVFECIFLAIRAGQIGKHNEIPASSTFLAGRLGAMIDFGIVKIKDVEKAIWHNYQKNHEEWDD